MGELEITGSVIETLRKMDDKRERENSGKKKGVLYKTEMLCASNNLSTSKVADKSDGKSQHRA